MPDITVKDLRFAFDDEPLFDGLNFSCGSGDFICFLGASGCGKSTLLRLIAGLLTPGSGQLSVDGNANTGFVFQKPTLCPWRSALRNVELPLQLIGMGKERKQQAREALDSVGLREADFHKLPQQLSGGMQMRVSLARALVRNPNLMLMDEPFSALDEVRRQQLCEACLSAWREQHWTTVFVTHNVTEAVFMSQRIHILSSSPARIVETIDVPFGPRNAKLRGSVEFLQLVADTSQRLRDAVETESTRR